MTTRIAAWDNLHETNQHITRIGWYKENKDQPLEQQHVIDELDKLYNSNLTVAQINSISELLYYAYHLGKSEKLGTSNERKQRS